MPVQYDLPEWQGLNDIQDVNQYQKLPFYLAMLEAKYFPQWQLWNKLFGTLNWTPNMGSTLRGVRAEPTPVGRQSFYPASIQGQPNKDVFENFETYEEATLAMHDFDSKQFSFLPSFQDFRENQIDFTHKDIVRQMAITNDIFFRSYMLQKLPYIYIPGNATELTPCPAIQSGTAVSAASVAASGKNQAFWAAQIAAVNAGGVLGLTLATMDDAVAVFRDDLGAPFFEGTVNTPKDNELIKGKYLMVSSNEAYQMIKWDPNFRNFRDVNIQVTNDGFRGEIFGELTWKSERYPLRFKVDGSNPAPEVYDPLNNRTVPNPDYVSAPYELAFLVGAEAFKMLKVGPPPKPFASGKMDAAKFYSMNWNGEVRLTDQILVNYNNGVSTTPDLNYRGRFLKLFSTVIYGAIPVNQRFILPILFKRKRPSDLIVPGAPPTA